MFHNDFNSTEFSREFERLFTQKNSNIYLHYTDAAPKDKGAAKTITFDLQQQCFMARYIEADIEFQIRHVYAEFIKCLKDNTELDEKLHFAVNMNKWEISYDDEENAYIYTVFFILKIESLNTPAIYKE
jgi:hypothetical protein